jgi:AcrR family transcriptional regulator
MARQSSSISGAQSSRAAADARPRGRPPIISNERLLAVAREVFLELGIRATTLEVARRAGVAEGTIFHRFKSKEDLFRAAMQFDPDQALAFVERLPSLAGTGDLRCNLLEFAEEFLRLGRIAVPVMMMSWSNPDSQFCQDRVAEKGERHRRVIAAIAAFFQGEMQAGRLRPTDTEVLARMLLGSLHQYCMSELFTRGVAAPSPPHFAAAVVDVLLRAAAVGGHDERRSPARRPAARRRRASEVSK